MRRVATLAVLFAVSTALAGQKDDKDKKEKAAVREIPLTGDLKIAVAPPDKGKVTEPTSITAANELPKFPLFRPPAVEALKKQIDFDKEKLVVFWWGGSGQDALAGELKTEEAKPDPKSPDKGAGKKTTATFTYTPGRTRDLRGHLKLFVVPKDAEVKVETGK